MKQTADSKQFHYIQLLVLVSNDIWGAFYETIRTKSPEFREAGHFTVVCGNVIKIY